LYCSHVGVALIRPFNPANGPTRMSIPPPQAKTVHAVLVRNALAAQALLSHGLRRPTKYHQAAENFHRIAAPTTATWKIARQFLSF
jgi:hypothetical protein